MQFDLPKEQSSIIKVIGVGGGGSNAVNHMFSQGIRGVNFVISNTDEQALEISPVPNKIQLGPDLTEGLGAGSNPEIGRLATEESLEDLKTILEKNTKMVFVTAGMGGGTGTGGAPVAAKLAKEMGILTVGIVTTPFFFEGRRKMKQAEAGIEELRQNVDSLIVISNDKIREIYGNLTRDEAFARADDILTIAAKSISEIITVAGQINVDFADVEYVMKNSGVAIMGSGNAEGEGRAAKAIQEALASPLLNDNNIQGAEKILLNISSGTNQVLIDEITEIHEIVQEAAGYDTDVIFGTCDDEILGDKISVTIIATGFEKTKGLVTQTTSSKVVHTLEQKPAFRLPVNPSFEEAKAKPAKEVKDTEVNEAKETQQTVWNLEPETPIEQENKQTEKVEMELFETEKKNTADLDELNKETTNEIPAGENTSKVEKELKYVPGVGFTIVENEVTPSQSPELFKAQDEVRKDLDHINNERIKRLRNLSLKLSNPNNINELENEPAFKRRNIMLSNDPHSSEQNMSKYTLSDDEDEASGTGIKRNNSFLHDNVD